METFRKILCKLAMGIFFIPLMALIGRRVLLWDENSEPDFGDKEVI